MPGKPPTLQEVLAQVVAFCRAHFPGEVPVDLVVKLVSGRKLVVPLPPPGVAPEASGPGAGHQPPP